MRSIAETHSPLSLKRLRIYKGLVGVGFYALVLLPFWEGYFSGAASSEVLFNLRPKVQMAEKVSDKGELVP